MKAFPTLVLGGALALATALPIAGLAQQAAPQPQATGASQMAPMQPGHRHGMFPLVRRLNLTAQQRSQIRSIVQQYRASHPKGSPRDPQAFRAMRKQVIGVLTPQQRTQLRSEVRQHRAPGSTVFPSPAASPRPL